MRKILFVLLIILPISSFAYPDFIGYGYNTCATCHYNPHGNGPLTDYGRAIFSQEIANRSWWLPAAVSDEVAAERSGFVPGVELPYWIRPSVKYRGLWMETNPGSASARRRYIHMQRDLNVVLSADQSQRTIVSVTYGLLDRKDVDFYGTGQRVDAVTREHYVRFFPAKKLLVAVGLMDIVYGLRIEDHTSVSRSAIGLGQNDQTHGVVLQWQEKEWDVSAHAIAGNFFEDEERRDVGVALQGEYSLLENDRVGASFMHTKSDLVKQTRLGLHNRWGLPNAHGSSLLAELGLKKDAFTNGGESPVGVYGIFRALINLTRGYNLFSTVERSQSEIKFGSTEAQRWTFGFLTFPWERTEVRMTSVQSKTFSPSGASADRWMVQGQVHVSF